MDFINDMSAENIFNLIKAQYKTDTGYSIQIGSDEFAIASMISYIFGVLVSRFNEQAKQRYLSTATGEYLNAIAETYGISRPKPTHATMQVALTIVGTVTLTLDYRLKYNNLYFRPMQESTSGHAHSPTEWDVVFIGADENVDVLSENNIPAGEQLSWVTSLSGVISAYTASVSSGASDIYPMTDTGDDAFRAYIKSEIAGVSVGGPARAYERLAKDSDSRILDVYCARYNDSVFEAGIAKLYILTTEDDYDNHWAEIQANVTNATKSDDVRPVCDSVSINAAQRQAIAIHVYAKASAQYGATARNKLIADMESYAGELNSILGPVFSITELSRRARTPDGNGTRLELVQCTDPTQSLIELDSWEGATFSFVLDSYAII